MGNMLAWEDESDRAICFVVYLEHGLRGTDM